MADRFFSDEPLAGERAQLAGVEAHHLLHVLRARVGDEVTLFDGSGAEFTARVDSLGRTAVSFVLGERREVDRELPARITLGVSLPKGDRQRWLIEKAVELGVAELVPLVTRRGVAQPTADALDRLRRSVVEASKQCGRNRLMQIRAGRPVADYFNADATGNWRWLAHPRGESLAALLNERSGPPEKTPVPFLAVGPEGGFTDDEVAQAVQSGWRTVSLGKRILRIETAACFLAAVLAAASE